VAAASGWPALAAVGTPFIDLLASRLEGIGECGGFIGRRTLDFLTEVVLFRRRSHVNPRRRHDMPPQDWVSSSASAHGRSYHALPVIRGRSGQRTAEPDMGAAALLVQQVQDEQHQRDSGTDGQRRPIPQIGDPRGQHSQPGPAQDAVDRGDQTGPGEQPLPRRALQPHGAQRRLKLRVGLGRVEELAGFGTRER
jgi:hypothetical protein